MKFDQFKKKSSKIPAKPGVYFFLSDKKDVLYIGKATSIRERLRSYFSNDLFLTRGGKIVTMIEKAKSFDWKVTDSVLEALILEAELIKNYSPKYNTNEKDDKSFNYVVVTEEVFPRLLVIRGRNLGVFLVEHKAKETFGPFTNGASLREALKIIRKIFPYRDNCTPYVELKESDKLKAKPCFNAQIGLCPGVCINSITRQEYGRIIRHIILFFKGKKKALLRQLNKEMKAFAKLQKFEKAGEVKDTIFAIEHINDVAIFKNDISRQSDTKFRIEAYDIAHLSGTDVVGVMTVMENGVIEKNEYRKFNIKGLVGTGRNDDVNNLKEVLERRLTHPEWPMPNLIVVDGGVGQLNAAQAVLKLNNFDIEAVAVTKNEKHKPRHILGKEETIRLYSRDILLTNSEAHRFALAFHKKKRSQKFM